MLKKRIKYTDYNGVEREEDFHFNLTEAELMEMELSEAGGITAQVEKIIQEKKQEKIVEIFKDIILKSYGEKSADGKRFIKNDEVRASFEQNPAYSWLFMKLATDADAAKKFVKGIVPVVKEEQPNTAPNRK